MICHVCVLIGNCATSQAMVSMGESTGGWSNVGLGLGRSFDKELSVIMNNVSAQILKSLEKVLESQTTMNEVLSLIGNVTDEEVAKRASLLQMTDVRPNLNTTQDPFAALGPFIEGPLRSALHKFVGLITEKLFEFMQHMKPALLKIGEFIIKFADDVQDGLQTFSVTIDKIQKIFDQAMQRLHGPGANEEEMIYQTFKLYDTHHTGFVTIEDLHQIADVYTITALSGDKAVQLLHKYDDGDGRLSKAEFTNFIRDPSIPYSMAVILRTFAHSLSKAGAECRDARMRSEVALSLTHYLGVVSSKNMTKVGWIADRLGNASLPLPFTSDVLVQFCLNEDDPNKLTSIDVGQLMVHSMYQLHPGQTIKAIELMASPKYWLSEGFDPKDQPVCLQRVATWLSEAEKASAPLKLTTLLELEPDEGDEHKTFLVDMHGEALKDSVVKDMPTAAWKVAQRRMSRHLAAERQEKQAKYEALFSGSTSQHLLVNLLGGVPAGASSSLAQQAIKSGVPAVPATLQFAQWVYQNATKNADIYTAIAFTYSSQSSNAMDSFATKIKSFVKRTQGFIAIMKKYATPQGIAQLENMIEQFASKALGDIVKLIDKKVDSWVNKSIPLFGKIVSQTAHSLGDKIGDEIADVIVGPMSSVLDAPIDELLRSIFKNPKVSDQLGSDVSPLLAKELSNATGSIAGNILGDAIDTLAKIAAGVLTNASAAPTSIADIWKMALTQDTASIGMNLDHVLHESSGEPSGVFHEVVTVLATLSDLLPTATSMLTLARNEVTSAASSLNQIFAVFNVKGPKLFHTIAFYFKVLWIVYFCLLGSSTLGLLYYALWASGFFGGPQPNESDVEVPYDDAAEPAGCCCERLIACWSSCSSSLRKSHDSAMCFWSVIMLLQIIVLVLFLVSIVLCILAGVKAFIVAGCGSIYILGDHAVCSDALGTLKVFLGTFFVGSPDEVLSETCSTHTLMTCKMIVEKMKASTMLTTVFSFLAAVMSFQLLIESGCLHERAKYRRMAKTLEIKHEVRQPGST